MSRVKLSQAKLMAMALVRPSHDFNSNVFLNLFRQTGAEIDVEQNQCIETKSKMNINSLECGDFS